MRTELLILLVFSLIRCTSLDNANKENSSDTYDFKCDSTLATDQLLFSVQNLTNHPIQEIRIGFPDTSLLFKRLRPNEQSDCQLISRSYRYGPLHIEDENNNVFEDRPFCYSGETLYTNGILAYKIMGLDTSSNSIRLDHSYFSFTETIGK